MWRHLQYKTLSKNSNFLIIYKYPDYSIGIDNDANDLLQALHEKYKNQYIQTIFNYQSYLSGVVILVKNKYICDELRNLYGSQKITLEFQCISKNTNDIDNQQICNLPIAKHLQKDVMLISNQTGKKTQTQFTILENINNFSLISAKTNYLREDQILLHAYESGLSIYGDETYAKLPVPTLEYFKRRVKSNRKGKPMPLYNCPCVYLSKITIDFTDELLSRYIDLFSGLDYELNKNEITFSCEMPDKMQTFIKICKQ